MDSFVSKLWNILNDASKLIIPKRCVLCGRRLRNREDIICISCYVSLPFTLLKGEKGNRIERYFWGQFPIVRANAFLHYFPQTDSSHIFLQLKYGHRPDIGYYMGRCMAAEIFNTDFFDGIDCIVPVPLSPARRRQRGYNQSEELAKGVSAITHIPIDTHSLVRKVFKGSQTQLNAEQRKDNVKNVFYLTPQQELDHKHILLMDDIVTTGATIISCASEIGKAQDVKISILTLGMARSFFAIRRIKEIPENPPIAYSPL